MDENEKLEYDRDSEAYHQVFLDYCREDVEEVLTVCTVASQELFRRFNSRIDDPELIAVVFFKTFTEIMHHLKSEQKDRSEFKLNICNKLFIGYSTNENDDDEKEGNYMVFIRHGMNPSKVERSATKNEKSSELMVRWNTENIIDNPEVLRSISKLVVQKCTKIKVQLGTSEIVFPLFILVYDALVTFVTEERKRLKKFEYEINFMNCFNISCRAGKDNDGNPCDEIIIRPAIYDKQFIKDDQGATGIHD